MTQIDWDDEADAPLDAIIQWEQQAGRPHGLACPPDCDAGKTHAPKQIRTLDEELVEAFRTGKRLGIGRT